MKYNDYENQTIKDLRDMLRSSVELYGGHDAFLEKHDGVYKPVTYDEFYRDVRCLGAALRKDAMPERRIIVIGETAICGRLSYMTVVCGWVSLSRSTANRRRRISPYISRFAEADTILYAIGR